MFSTSRMLIVAASLAATSTAAQATCRVTGAQGVRDAEVNMVMRVMSGTLCSTRNMTFTYGRGRDSRRFPTSRLRIVERPRLGTVEVQGSRTFYRARARGTDSYVYEARTTSVQRPGTYRYRVNIEIY